MLRSVALVVLVACAHPAVPLSPAEQRKTMEEIAKVLDDWHDAAARSSSERYFGHFAEGGVFLGTDATERWDAAAFRAYAHEPFSKGKGWVMKAVQRNITLGPPGVAWFDEALETKNLGPARGSGVMLRDAAGQWKIAQYNLTITIPNERFGEVKTLLESPPASAPTR
jgi:hypothetical protein